MSKKCKVILTISRCIVFIAGEQTTSINTYNAMKSIMIYIDKIEDDELDADIMKKIYILRC